MKRFTISGVFIASQMLASILIVVIMTYGRSQEDQASFFLFQAVYFPLTALLAQTKTLLFLKGQEENYQPWLIDVAIFVLSVGLLTLLGAGRYDVSDLVFYSGSICVMYRIAITLLDIQQRGSNHYWVIIIPLSTAIIRISTAYFSWFDRVSLVFFLSAVLAYGFSIAVRHMVHNSINVQLNKTKEPINFLLVLSFSGASSFAFQWDRMVFSYLMRDDLIISAGVCLLWVLSPLSAIYSTIYRAEAQQIFKDQDKAFKNHIFRKNAKLFLACIFVYCIFIFVLWEPLNTLAFPTFNKPVYLPLLLIGAITMDRLGNLKLFIYGNNSLYTKFTIAKLIIMAVGILSVLTLGPTVKLIHVFMIYFLVSTAYYLIGSVLASK